MDTYISAIKVQEANKAIGVDTTAIKPRLSVNHFINFRNRRAKWIDIFNLCKENIKYVVSYDSMMKLSSDEDRVRGLRGLLQASGVKMKHDADVQAGVGTVKQDSSSRRAEKVDNYNEFLDECRERGVPTGDDLAAIDIPVWDFAKQ